MDTLRTPDRHPNGCEIIVPVILKVPLCIEPVVIESSPGGAGQEQAIAYSEPESVHPEPESVHPKLTPVKAFDDVPTVFKPDFNNFAALNLTQTWRLFSTVGRVG